MLIKNLVKPIKLHYSGKKTLGLNAYIFTLEPQEPVSWKAGQHALLEITPKEGHRLLEAFPIVSAPSENIFRIATKIKPESHDQFKHLLLRLKIGDELSVRGIFGRTIIKRPYKEYAFLTNGIGIATFRAILKQLVLDNQLDTKITLFFVGDKDNHHFKDELSDFKTSLKNLQIEYIYKPERITGQTLEDKLGNRLHSITYFIAGSPTIVRNYRRILLGLGIKPRMIKSNHYPLIKNHQHENPIRPLIT
jgi:ferredoxin-NADP reductase